MLAIEQRRLNYVIQIFIAINFLKKSIKRMKMYSLYNVNKIKTVTFKTAHT